MGEENGITNGIIDLTMMELDINEIGPLIGRRLRVARRAAGLNQTELAALLSKELKVPLSMQAISKWELGGREKFHNEEITAFAKVLKRNRDFFVTQENEIFHGEGIKSIRPIDESRKWRIPLIDFNKIRWGIMEELVKSHTGDFYVTYVKQPGGGFAFEWPETDNSMEPMMKPGRSVVAVGFGLEAIPEAHVLVDYQGQILFRHFSYEGELIVLTPHNRKWRVYKFTPEQWENDVKKIAVMTAFETPGVFISPQGH